MQCNVIHIRDVGLTGFEAMLLSDAAPVSTHSYSTILPPSCCYATDAATAAAAAADFKMRPESLAAQPTA